MEDSENVRERLKKQRERWLREREIDKDKQGKITPEIKTYRGWKRNTTDGCSWAASTTINNENIG